MHAPLARLPLLQGMSDRAYTEDTLVEPSAIGSFAALGRTTESALEEAFGTTGAVRLETKSEVVLEHSKLTFGLEEKTVHILAMP